LKKQAYPRYFNKA